MAELTKERLTSLSNRENVGAICGDEIAAMARQLLTGMEQEPVHQACKEAGVWVDIEPGDVDSLKANGEQVRALYAAPQLPQPAVVSFDEWSRKCDLQIELCDRDFRDKAQYIWNACRAAMLQGGNHTEQHLDMVGHSGDANEKVNSPVIPDGWQLVPKEPTVAMNKAGWAAINKHDEINPTYRAMLAEAPQQEVKK